MMDVEEFPTSPAKRQRTASPERTEQLALDPPPSGAAPETQAQIGERVKEEEKELKDAVHTDSSSNSLLDALMSQVEAESSSMVQPQPITQNEHEQPADSVVPEEPQVSSAIHDQDADHDSTDVQVLDAANGSTLNQLAKQRDPIEDSPETITSDIPVPASGPIDVNPSVDVPDHPVAQSDAMEITADTNISIPTVANALDTPATMAASATDGIPADSVLESGQPIEGAEWEVDSSPYDSSSDSDTSSDDSSEDDSEEDGDGDYAMLDPEEAARILMQGDGGSDDEGEGSKKKEGGQLRTANECFEEVIPKPDIIVTEAMNIEELGNVEFVVENTVVIKAKTSGEYRVLEAGSLICRNDRSVVGVVADLIGRVEEPRYTIRFTNHDDIRDAGLSELGTTVFYVPDHSTFVFTLPLKAVKGSDASNFHDEEVGDDEMEFSDDEAEAEHKRQAKAKRQGRTLESSSRGGRGGSKFPRGSNRGGGRGRGGYQAGQGSNSADGSAYGSGSLEMNYDDVPMPDSTEDGYTPLQRPADLADMMTRGEPPQERPMQHSLPPPPPPSQFSGSSDFSGRGRGYNNNRGGRGGRGSSRPYRGRGGFSQHRENQHNQSLPSTNGYQTGFSQQNGYAYQNNFSTPTVPNINVPNTPSITPHNVSYPPMTPSPITPLPTGSFNFGRGFQPPTNFSSFPPPPPPPTGIPGLPAPPPFPQSFNYQHQPPQLNQYQSQPQQSYPPTLNATTNGQASFLSGAWANNPAVAAALQRQIEEQRRMQGGGQ